MNARISREFTLDAGIHYEGRFLINSYVMELFMDVTTEDVREQNIALERVKYLLTEALDSCVFVDYQDVAAIDNYLKANMKVCPVPEGPYDQIIGSVLMSKFNAVTEGKLFVTEVKICSRICDDLNFYVEYDEEMPLHTNIGTWWHENNTSICDIKLKPNRKEKIVELKRESKDWDDVGLTWKPKTKGKPKIVYIDPAIQTD